MPLRQNEYGETILTLREVEFTYSKDHDTLSLEKHPIGNIIEKSEVPELISFLQAIYTPS